MTGHHERHTVSCARCDQTYCVQCNSSCPSCCFHSDCIAVKERDTALEALEEAQETATGYANDLEIVEEKIEELARLTYDLHQRSGHPDSACLRCQFYRILKEEK